MKRIFLAVALLCPFLAQANEDKWTGSDKAMHFAVSGAVSLAAYSYTEDKTQAFLIGMAPGVLKEIVDSQQEGNRFSGKDLAWDALGAFVGVQIGDWTIDEKGVSWGRSYY